MYHVSRDSTVYSRYRSRCLYSKKQTHLLYMLHCITNVYFGFEIKFSLTECSNRA